MNPWEVKSLEDFSYYCCSECSFKTKEAATYRSHLNVHMGVLSNDNEQNDENHEEKMPLPLPLIKDEPYFDGQEGIMDGGAFRGAFEPNVNIKEEPHDAEHEEKYDTR